jgi:hypothetical protein
MQTLRSGTTADALPEREVLYALSLGNKKPPLCGDFKPSPGLEPGTASLPWRIRALGGGAWIELYAAVSR